MKLAIIGAGAVGKALGGGWAARGHDVVYGARDPAKTAGDFGRDAVVVPLGEAAARGEAVLLSVPWPGVEDALAACGDLTGKILIDATNPLNYAPEGLSLATGLTSSGGERVAEFAPGARVVKAFNSAAAENMSRGADFRPPLVMFVAADDETAKAAVMRLAGDLDLLAADAGPLRNSNLLEGLAMLFIDQAYMRGRGRNFGFALVEPRTVDGP